MGLIQTSGLKQVNASTTSPDNFTMPGNFTAGHSAVVSLSYFQSSSIVISAISLGGSAATLESRTTDGAGAYVEIWRVQNLAGGSNSISVTSTTTSHFLNLSVEERDDMQAVAADIVATPGSGTSTAPSATYGTLAQADEIVYIAYVDVGGTNEASSTPPTSYTQAWVELNGSANLGGSGAYRVVSSTAGASPAFTLATSTGWRAVLVTFKLNPAGPTIDTQPQNATVYQGQTANFTVSATTSGGALSYQWKDDGVNVGTNSSSYTTAATVLGDNGAQITCAVTDSNGTTTTAAATLTVIPTGISAWIRA